jgi:uncharacterized protein YbjT (DUF2867 family)
MSEAVGFIYCFIGRTHETKELNMKVLVIGATGRLGSVVVKELLNSGASVRALVHKQRTRPQAVEIALGDLCDPPSIGKALEGVEKLFLLVSDTADELRQALTAYGLARRTGVKHITYLSVFQVDRFLDLPQFASKAVVEEAIKKYDVPFTILRPGYFMQNDVRAKELVTGPGVYPLPIGDTGIATVDIRDIAEAAATSLTKDGHAGKTYNLVSEELLSGPFAAAIWSEILRKEVRYAGHDNFDAFEEQVRKNGTPSWLAYQVRAMFQGWVERGWTTSPSDVAGGASLLGHRPRTYRSYAEEMAKQWDAAAAA